jgi:hypothetical protein
MPDITMCAGSVPGAQSIVDKLNRHGDLILRSIEGQKTLENLQHYDESIIYNDLKKETLEQRETLDLVDTQKYFETLPAICLSNIDVNSVNVDMHEEDAILTIPHINDWKPTFNKVT